MTLVETRGIGSLVGSMVATATPCAAVDPIGLFGAARAAGLDASLWLDAGTGRALVGVDVVARIVLDGPARFERLSRASRELLTGVRVDGRAAASPLAGPILMGGAAFRDQPPSDPRWEGFGSVAFDLPRLLVAVEDGSAVATSIGGRGDAVAPGRLLDRLLDDRCAAPPEPTAGLTLVGIDPERAAWSSSVARITGAVGRGRLDKVVLARRVDLRASRAIDPVGVLRRLTASDQADPSPGARLPSTVFAFARGRRAFLGSSPERLVSVRGDRLRTMALAGTSARDGDATRDAASGGALLASEKDREEHAVVVAMLRETLTPVTTGFDIPHAPRIVGSARLHHLLTDVTGVLAEGVRLLDVVGRLHPTPAVGGWPTEAALGLLDEESGLDRGWYAGPVGWLDRSGDGDMSVAIRSGVLDGRDASLYAGCGIVADSEPDLEWEESSLKLRVMGDALGWDAT